MAHQVAILMSEVFLRRLTPALMPFVRREMDYRIVSIHRPLDEIRQLLDSFGPHGVITEWLPQKTQEILDLKLGLPTVIVDTDYCYPGVISIDVDDWAVGRVAAESFRRGGFRSVACLGNGQPYSDQRIEGFVRTFQDREDITVSVHMVTGFDDSRYSESFVSPTAGFKQWLTDLPKPVGVFAVHDPLGRFLCGTCQQIGFKVPEDVAVIGANNDPLVCGLTYPMLSSVSIPWDTLGEVAGESMQQLIEGKKLPMDSARLIAPGGVVLRHSADYLAIEDPGLRRAMTWLSAHSREPISIGQMCKEMRMARRTLERKFAEHYRCTPWEMLCQIRVNQAKRLLVETNHPIALIADLAGFHDPERMAVVFKRLTGMAPSSYRKSRGKEA